MNFLWCGCFPDNEESTQICPNKKFNLPSKPAKNDNEIDKEGFKLLMLSFASRAKKNAPCFVLDTQNVCVVSATYTLDNSFNTFTVKSTGSDSIIIPITKLENVIGYEELFKHEDTSHWLDNPLIKSLSKDDLNRFVLIEYWDENGLKLNRLCLLEGKDLTTSDMFITCIKLLKMYSSAAIPAEAS